jgi:serine/threonine protein kinase
MSDPTDPALTVHKPPSADPDETAVESRGGSRGVPFGPPAAAGEVGVLGPYRLLKALGKGGMGAVYLAVDTRLDRKLALKVMLQEFVTDSDAKERFLREARAAAKITHDNVVTVYEADERDGVPYIAMQLLQGYPLDEFLTKKGTPSLRHVIRIARETALGLAAAHKHGLVHRDIKPANLWLEAPNGRVKVLDFGLAKPVGADVELTRTGAVVGTPAYMSPEQARGVKVDHRTDLFSLGVVLYRLCTGTTPFTGPTVMSVLMALGTEEPAPVRAANPNVPEPLAALIHQLLAKKPDDRPETAAEVARQLLVILEQLVQLPVSPEATSAAVPDGTALVDATDAATPRSGSPGARDNRTTAVSSSQPVVVDPVPVRPPLVSRLEVSARPMGGGEETSEPKPKRRAKREPEPQRAGGRGRVIAWAVAVLLLVCGIGAGVWLAVGRQKSTDTTQQKPDEKPDPTPRPVPDGNPVPPPDPKAGAPTQWKPRWTAPVGNKPALNHLYTSTASDLVLAISMQGDILALDLRTGAPRGGFKYGAWKVNAPDFFRLDGQRVGLSSSLAEEILVWDERTGQELPRLMIPHVPKSVVGVGTALRIYISPNARYAVAARYQGPSATKVEMVPLRVIDLEKKQVVAERTWVSGQVHFTADSSRVLIAEYQGRGTWLKLPSGAVDRQWEHPPGTGGRYHDVTGTSDDGSVLGYRGPEGRGPAGTGPAVLDGSNGQVIHLFPDEYSSTSPVSVSADGRRAAVQRASAEGSGGFDVLASRTGALIGRAPLKPDRSVPTFALTRDGTVLVIVSNSEKKVHVFEPEPTGGSSK